MLIFLILSWSSFSFQLLKQQANQGVLYSYTVPIDKYRYHPGNPRSPSEDSKTLSTNENRRYVSHSEYTATAKNQTEIAEQQPNDRQRRLQNDEATVPHHYRNNHKQHQDRLERSRARERLRQQRQSRRNADANAIADSDTAQQPQKQHRRHRDPHETSRDDPNSIVPTSTQQSQQHTSNRHHRQGNHGTGHHTRQAQPGINYGAPNRYTGQNHQRRARPGVNYGYQGNPIYGGSQAGQRYPGHGIPGGYIPGQYPQQGYPAAYGPPQPAYPQPGGNQVVYIPPSADTQASHLGPGYASGRSYGATRHQRQPGRTLNDQIALSLPESQTRPRLGILNPSADYSWKITGFTECTTTCGGGKTQCQKSVNFTCKLTFGIVDKHMMRYCNINPISRYS